MALLGSCPDETVSVLMDVVIVSTREAWEVLVRIRVLNVFNFPPLGSASSTKFFRSQCTSS